MNFCAKKRKGDLVFESNLVLSQRGIRAMPHAIPQTHSSVYCFYPHRFKSEIHVFLFIESWSRDQLMQKDLLTWLENLLFLDKRVFLTRLGLRFTYVTWLVSKWQAWLHVGGALGERHEINKSSLEIFDCILLSTRMIRLWNFTLAHLFQIGLDCSNLHVTLIWMTILGVKTSQKCILCEQCFF